MKPWLQPIRILLLYLIVLTILGTISWSRFDSQVLGQITLEAVMLFGGYSFIHFLLVRSKRIQVTRWEHQAITCLILLLLFEPGLPWYSYMIIGALAEVLQRVFRLVTGPLANPAALAIVAIALVGLLYQWTGFMGWYPLWWGVSFAPRLPIIDGGVSAAALLTIPIAGWVAHKYKKLWIVAAAVATLIPACLFVLGRSPLFILLEGTFAFFLLVMAIEPKTSPILRNQQLLYGALLSTLVVIGIKFGWYEAYTMSLVIVNVVFNLWKNKALLLKKVQQGSLKPIQSQANAIPEALNKPPQSQS